MLYDQRGKTHSLRLLIKAMILVLVGIAFCPIAQAQDLGNLPVYDRPAAESMQQPSVATAQPFAQNPQLAGERQAVPTITSDAFSSFQAQPRPLFMPMPQPLHPRLQNPPYHAAGYFEANSDDDYLFGVPVADKKLSQVFAPSTLAPIAFVIRADEKELFSRHIDVVTPMASLTKMTSILLALKSTDDLDQLCTISEHAASIGGNTMGYAAGTQVSLRELLQGMFIHSGNDAAIAVAEHLGGSVEAYCDKMTRLAQSLSCTSSNFVTPHGLDRPGHHSSARDSFIIAKELMSYPFAQKTAGRAGMSFNINGKDTYFPSTNSLIGEVEGVKGVKTGFTLQAGYCLLSYVENGQAKFYTLVMGLKSKEARAAESKKLIQWAFNFYPQKELISSREALGYLPYGYRFGSYLPAYISLSINYRVDLMNGQKIPVYQGKIDQELYHVSSKDQKIGSLKLKLAQQEEIERNIYSGTRELRIFELPHQSYFSASGRFRPLGVLSLP